LIWHFRLLHILTWLFRTLTFLQLSSIRSPPVISANRSTPLPSLRVCNQAWQSTPSFVMLRRSPSPIVMRERSEASVFCLCPLPVIAANRSPLYRHCEFVLKRGNPLLCHCEEQSDVTISALLGFSLFWFTLALVTFFSAKKVNYQPTHL
jgi:hypothetical protein